MILVFCGFRLLGCVYFMFSRVTRDAENEINLATIV